MRCKTGDHPKLDTDTTFLPFSAYSKANGLFVPTLLLASALVTLGWSLGMLRHSLLTITLPLIKN